MPNLYPIDGIITGNLVKMPTINGTLSSNLGLNGKITVPKKVVEKNYGRLDGKPFINGHELQSGENSLEELSIGLASRNAIDNFFRL